MLGSSYDTFIRINGPMLLVAVSKDGSLKDLAKEDVPVLCEGMIRWAPAKQSFGDTEHAFQGNATALGGEGDLSRCCLHTFA